MRKPQAIVLTISDSASRGERTDLSGPAAREELERLGCEVVSVTVVPDDLNMIREKLLEHSDSGAIDLIVTTGGTGLAPRDVTPEATQEVIEKSVPGSARTHADGRAEIESASRFNQGRCWPSQENPHHQSAR